MKRIVVLLIFFPFLLLFLGCETSSQPPIEYSVSINNSAGENVFMTVLVDTGTSKEDALKLGKYFQDKYKSKLNVVIAIFDNEWAVKNRSNMDVPTERIMKHYLVQYTKNKLSGMDKVQWMKGE